jgi:holin-like protein
MKILIQVGILFGVYWLSQCIEAVLPFTFPASVISLLLLLVLLLLGMVKVDHIREKSEFLLGNLGFFFVPVAAGVMNYVDVIQKNAVAFLTICVVSLVLTYGATVAAVRLTSRLLEKRGGAGK